jgi:hypothetical protein
VFETMRRKRRSNNMKSELGQGVDHFKRAASLAAQETSATVGPKFYAAKGRVQPAAVKAKGAATSSWDSALATLTPLVAAATESTRRSDEKLAKAGKKAAKSNKKNAKKLEKRADKVMNRKSSGRGSRLLGLALIGSAVGAGAAYVIRRRQTAQWDEYEPSRPVTASTTVTDTDAAFTPNSGITTGTTSTGSTGTGSTSTGSTSTGSTTGTGSTVSDSTTVVTSDTADQTSSAQHSPKVAKLASGQNTTGTKKD